MTHLLKSNQLLWDRTLQCMNLVEGIEPTISHSLLTIEYL